MRPLPRRGLIRSLSRTRSLSPIRSLSRTRSLSPHPWARGKRTQSAGGTATLTVPTRRTPWPRLTGVRFDARGYVRTGWVEDSGTWYYHDANGYMVTGWLNLGGTYYYLRETGAMATGWLNLGGTWYYLNASGAMATGWINLGGTWYYLDANGVWVK